MKTLIIAEKPSVARDIVGALPGSFDEHKNFYESDDYVVTFAVGHLLELSDPEDYDPAWKSWKLDNLPIIPDEFKVRPRDKKSATQLNLIHKLLKRKDVDRVVNACDAGREGELIFTHIYETSETGKPVDRLWINSMTKAAIRDGFEKLRPADQLEPLRDAARSRSEADWLVGMNATRAATTRRGWGAGVVSLGRVQTPTLSMMVKREREIQAFTPEPYWLFHAALQRDANRRFGFSARRTLSAAQSLYEGKKAITYPRTNSRWLSGDLVAQLKPTAETLVPIPDYERGARFVLGLDQLPLARVVNDAKVDDHHAIIPTDIAHDVSAFTPDERRIFDLVARRFLAVFHPPARYARTTVITEVEGERFRTRGKVTLEAGWRGVYGVEVADPAKQDEDAEGEGELPELKQGQEVRCAQAEAEAKETKPPPRYTEATLLSSMETAGKLVDDEELREAMKERGLGTPATRAEIIETLIRRQYIERAGKDLQPTPKGMSVVTMLEEHPITSAELNGDWEKQLSDIEHGNGDRSAFMDGIAGFAKTTVEQIASLPDDKIRVERVELGLCPKCGTETGEILKENSPAYGCTSWKSREEPGCGFVIWKRVAGRTLTPEIARQLLADGRTTEVLSGFRSRAGKPFRARLLLKEDGKVEFEFPVSKRQQQQEEAEEGQAEREEQPAAAE